MNAWLLTWVFTSTEPTERLVAVISSRRSEGSVAEVMELLVLRATSGARFNAYCANRKKELVHKARTSAIIHGIPHGDRIFCGHDPWLYGRKVKNLIVLHDEQSNEEVISWMEPDNYKFEDGGKKITVAEQGKSVVLRRPADRPLSKDIWPT